MSRTSILSLCVPAVIAYTVVPWLLIGRSVEAAGLALWTASPLAALLLVAAVSRCHRTRAAAASLLACLWIVGAALLLWGLVFNPGDYNHLIVIFLPLYMFAFIVAAAFAYGVFALARALVRSTFN